MTSPFAAPMRYELKMVVAVLLCILARQLLMENMKKLHDIGLEWRLWLWRRMGAWDASACLSSKRQAQQWCP